MHTFRPGIGACFVVLGLSAIAGAQQTTGEYQPKAAYLYNIAKTTQWPAAALEPGPHETFESRRISFGR